MKNYIFTSESVSEGHPDKVADQISDAVLDACLKTDPESRVACETYTTTGMVLIGGEITTSTYVDIQELARQVVKDIGYTNASYGLDYESMAILNTIHSQSPDICQGVSGTSGMWNGTEYEGHQGAGDQGMMFGYACNETPELMPAPIYYSHKLLQKAAELRKSGKLPWLRPDAKSQVSFEYRDGNPVRITSVVLSHQHDDGIEHREIRGLLREQVIQDVLIPSGYLDKNTKPESFYINPTGRFVIGGPHGDTGLTGRKIIVDTYGGMGRHGGGAFSGKDPSKVDRSAAYMARYIAKNVVAAKLAERCEVQLSYAIGVPWPISVMVDTFGTADAAKEEKIAASLKKVFDLNPAGIIATLDLKRPIYQATASYGHFGRSEFPWEKTDKVTDLQKAVS